MNDRLSTVDIGDPPIFPATHSPNGVLAVNHNDTAISGLRVHPRLRHSKTLCFQALKNNAKQVPDVPEILIC